MKKIFLFILVLISIKGFSQYPVNTGAGSQNTLWYQQGGIGANLGFVFRQSYGDTTAANLSFIKNVPGHVIRVIDTLWMRNNTATAWIKQGGAAGNPSLQNVTDVGATTTNNLTTGLINWRYSGTTIGNLTAVVSGSNYGGALALKDYATSFSTILYPQNGLSAPYGVYLPKTGNATDTIFTFHDWRTLGGGGDPNPWSSNFDGIYYNGGNVYIGSGITGPTYKFQVDGNSIFNSYIDLIDNSGETFGNPASDRIRFFQRNDSMLYRNSSGVEVYVGGGGGTVTNVSTTDNNLNVSTGTTTPVISTNKAVQSLTDGATITWDMQNGYNATVTLGGNRTLSITNAQAGQYGTIIIEQDATGSRTITLPAGSKVINGGSGAVTLSTAGFDILTFFYDGTNYFWTIGKNFN